MRKQELEITQTKQYAEFFLTYSTHKTMIRITPFPDGLQQGCKLSV